MITLAPPKILRCLMRYGRDEPMCSYTPRWLKLDPGVSLSFAGWNSRGTEVIYPEAVYYHYIWFGKKDVYL